MSLPAARRTQPELFPVTSPLVERLGAAFFRSLPQEPGVYFFYSEAGALLYIGQSCCLRNRLGSYRFVNAGRHPRRTFRLIARVFRIEWQICGTAREAIELEARLLLEHRPPFNRAGVWKGPLQAVRIGIVKRMLHVELTAEAEAEAEYKATAEATGSLQVVGSMPAGFRYAFGAFVRVLHARSVRSCHWWDFPHGMLRGRVAPRHCWAVEFAEMQECPRLMAALQFLQDGGGAWVESAEAEFAEAGLVGSRQQFWQEQFETLTHFAGKRRQLLLTEPSS